MEEGKQQTENVYRKRDEAPLTFHALTHQRVKEQEHKVNGTKGACKSRMHTGANLEFHAHAAHFPLYNHLDDIGGGGSSRETLFGAKLDGGIDGSDDIGD